METIAYKIFENPNDNLKKIIENNDIVTHDILCDSLESITDNKKIVNNIRNDKIFKEKFVDVFETIWIASLSNNTVLEPINEHVIYTENYKICQHNNEESPTIENDWVSV